MSDEGRRLTWKLVQARNIFSIFLKKNNLGYVDTSCLETFLNHCTVFTSLGKVRADFSSFCGLKY
jgi:hypothetical protein